MKDFGKRLLSILVVLVIVLSMIPAQPIYVHAADEGTSAQTESANEAVVLDADGNVAEEYATLYKAIVGAAAGQTIQLLKDVTYTTQDYYLQKNLTIDLAGKTLTMSNANLYIGKSNSIAELAFISSTETPGEMVIESVTASRHFICLSIAGCAVSFDNINITANGALFSGKDFINGSNKNQKGYTFNKCKICFTDVDFYHFANGAAITSNGVTTRTPLTIKDSTIYIKSSGTNTQVFENCQFIVNDSVIMLDNVKRGAIRCYGEFVDSQFTVGSNGDDGLYFASQSGVGTYEFKGHSSLISTTTKAGNSLSAEYLYVDSSVVASTAYTNQATITDVSVDHTVTKGNVTAPTCTEPGYTTYTCSCGEEYMAEYTFPTGHSYTSVVTAPTCTNAGYTTHTCSACGDSYTDTEVAALGHEAGAAATCTSAQTCIRCDYVFQEALGHSYVDGVCTECSDPYDIEDFASAIAKGGVVKLDADITVDAVRGNVTVNETDVPYIFHIPEGVEVTIDLNGHTITSTVEGNAHLFLNQGTLTVTDTAETKGKAVAGVGGGSAVRNLGGTVTLTNGVVLDSNNVSHYTVYTAGGTLTIENATVYDGFGAVQIVAGATAVINDGNFYRTLGGDNTAVNQQNIVYVETAELTINGGNFIAETTKKGAAVVGEYDATITINGGSFDGPTMSVQSRAESDVNIYGGVFSDPFSYGGDTGAGVITNYIDENTEAVSLTSGVATFAVDSTGGTTYYVGDGALAEAFAAAQDGDIITLLNNVVLTASETNGAFTIAGDRKLTLNLNGYDITASAREGYTNRTQYAFDNYADLTIVGEGTITSRGIQNYGTLTIDDENVTIVACDANGGACVWGYAGSVTNISAGVYEAPNGTAVCLNSEGTLNVTGGKFTASGQGNAFAITVAGNGTFSNAEVTGAHGVIAVTKSGNATINSGTYTLTGVSEQTDSLLYTASGTITVNGGNFIAANEDTSESGRIIGAYDTGSAVVNDGTFTGNGWFDFADSAVENVTVNGGTYENCDDTVKAYVAENKSITLNGEIYTNVPPASGTISNSQINMNDPNETFLAAEITGLNATESVEIKLYSGQTQIATTKLLKSEYFTASPLSVKIIITGDSSSWETVWAEGMPHADYVPDTLVLYVDGQEMNSADVPMISTNGEAAVNWADVPGVASNVAQIGETKYTSLADAVAAAQDGDTITLLKDIELSATVVVNKSVTLDLNGKTINSAEDWVFNNYNQGLLSVARGSHLVIEDSVGGGVIDGTELYFAVSLTRYGDSATGDAAVLTINGGKLIGGWYAVAGNGSRDNTEIIINDGELVGVAYDAIYHPQQGTLTINGGKLTGNYCAIYMKSGSLAVTAINGGVLIGTNDGALGIENIGGSGYQEIGMITVSGGTFITNSEDYDAVYSIDGSEDGSAGRVVGFISGGTFNTEIAEDLLAEGYICVDNGDGTYSVRVALPEAQITDIKDSLTANDPDLTFALNFKIDIENMSEEYINQLLETYGSYYVDYILTVNKTATFNANGNVDGYLAGQYDAWSENWVTVPFSDVTVNANESLYIMAYAAELMGSSGLKYTLAEIAAIVQDFDCGVYFTPEFLAANPDLEVTLELVVYQDAGESFTLATNEFTAPAAAVTKKGEQTRYYDSLAEAIAAAQSGETVEMLADASDIGSIRLSENVTIEGNGHTISGKSSIHLAPTGGAINNVVFKDIADPSATKLTPIYATDWEAGATYSITNCVFDNVEYEAMQITDTDETVNELNLVVTGNEFKNSATAYRYIHVQLNSTEGGIANLTINGNKFYTDGTVAAAIGVYYVDDASTVDMGKNYIDDTSKVAVMLKNADNTTYNGATAVLPLVEEDLVTEIQYAAVLSKANLWQSAFYTSLADALAAAEDGDTILIFAGTYTGDLTINKAITVEGETDAEGNNLVTFNGKLNITADNATAKNLNIVNTGNGCYVNAKDVLIEGCEITGSNGLRYCYTDGTITFRDSKITGSTYGIHFDGNCNGNVVIENCEITGWTSFAATIDHVSIKNTTFLDGNYNLLRFYQNATVEGCTFPSGNADGYNTDGMRIDTGNGGAGMEGVTVTFTDCVTADGTDLEGAIPGEVIVASDVYVDDVLLVRVAKIGDTYYETLTEALAAAQDGDTVTVLADVELTDTIVLATKGSITLDGNGHTIKLAESFANDTAYGATFMLGYSNWKDSAIVESTYTIKNVTFDGITGNSIIRAQGITLNVEDSIVMNCDSSVNLFRIDYTEATFNNVTFKDNKAFACISFNSNTSWDSQSSLKVVDSSFTGNDCAGNALVIVNDGANFELTDSEFIGNTLSGEKGSVVYMATNGAVTGNYFSGNAINSTNANKASVLAGPWEAGEFAISITGNAFLDENVPGAFVEGWTEYNADSSYILDENYWGEAPNYGMSGEAEVKIDTYYTAYTYENGELTLAELVTITYVAEVNGEKYESLAAAFAAAKKGDVIELLSDITVTEQIKVADNSVLSDITLNGNGHTITAQLNKDNQSVLYFGDTATGAWATGVKINDLTITGTARFGIALMGGTSSELNNVTVEGDYYYGINFYGTHGATLTDCDIVTVFTNGQDDYPLNLVNSHIGHLYANKSDVADTAKVFIDETSSVDALTFWGDTTVMIDPASAARIGTINDVVAEVNGIYCKTLQAAVDTAADGDTITVIADHELNATVVVDKNVTIDLGGKTITNVCGTHAFRIAADVTVKNGTVDSSAGGYAFIVGYNTPVAGNLTVESGSYYGSTTVISVTYGSANITGGYFQATEYNGGYDFTLNCVDRFYDAGTAKITVTGGSFYGFDPKNNAAEGDSTNFCAPGYKGVTEDNIVWTVAVDDTVVAWNVNTGVEYETVMEALLAAYGSNATVQILADSEEDYIMIPAGVTLDLNGKVLTTSSVASFGAIIDTANVSQISGGKIVVPEAAMAMPRTNGGYLPVWEDNGYIFVMVDLYQWDVAVNDENKVVISFANYNTASDEYLADVMEQSENDLTIVVRASWTTASGDAATQEFKIKDETEQTYGNMVNTAVTKMDLPYITFYISGAESLENFQVCAVYTYQVGNYVVEVTGVPTAPAV